jgi:uncharacterized protein
MIRFLDTYGLFAWVNPKEKHHVAAKSLMASVGDHYVTTDCVLLEFADGMVDPLNRTVAVAMIRQMRTTPVFDIVRCDPSVFEAGFNLYSLRPDKDWSLTDCISFVVMETRGIVEAVTGDHHFRQAGFHPMF